MSSALCSEQKNLYLNINKNPKSYLYQDDFGFLQRQIPGRKESVC